MGDPGERTEAPVPCEPDQMDLGDDMAQPASPANNEDNQMNVDRVEDPGERTASSVLREPNQMDLGDDMAEPASPANNEDNQMNVDGAEDPGERTAAPVLREPDQMDLSDDMAEPISGEENEASHMPGYQREVEGVRGVLFSESQLEFVDIDFGREFFGCIQPNQPMKSEKEYSMKPDFRGPKTEWRNRFIDPMYRRRRLKYLERMQKGKNKDKEVKYNTYYMKHPDVHPMWPTNKGSVTVQWPSKSA